MHKCVRCGNTYKDNDSSILRGCTQCSGIFFLYIKGEADTKQLDAVQRDLQERDTTLEKELVKQIEKRRSKKRVRKRVKKKIKRKVKVKAKVKKKVGKKKVRKRAVKKKPRKEKVRKEIVRKEKAEKIEKPEKIVRKEVIKIGKEKFAVEDIFGIETVRVPKDGVYEINIDGLMKKRPVIVLERGQVYLIHLPLLFEELSEI